MWLDEDRAEVKCFVLLVVNVVAIVCQALVFQQRAVFMSERVLGIDHPNTITEYVRSSKPLSCKVFSKPTEFISTSGFLCHRPDDVELTHYWHLSDPVHAISVFVRLLKTFYSQSTNVGRTLGVFLAFMCCLNSRFVYLLRVAPPFVFLARRQFTLQDYGYRGWCIAWNVQCACSHPSYCWYSLHLYHCGMARLSWPTWPECLGYTPRWFTCLPMDHTSKC